MKNTLSNNRKLVFACVILFAVLVTIYGNSFHGEWHFDDVDIIVHNPNLHVNHLSWQEITRTFYYKEHLYRPVSGMSFGLNHYLGQLNVGGYHAVNFAIHCITALFLFLFIRDTFCLPAMRDRFGAHSHSIALLATLLWAVNPVQVLAVSYIVQRMASLTGMFYIMAMYFYVRGRRNQKLSNGFTFYALSLICGLLAFGSKENAATIPLVIFLYDLFLIQGVTKKHVRKNMPAFLFIILGYIIVMVFYIDMSTILAGYTVRPFTLWERLLTEPRVILYYISLLLYPTGSRLAFLHDIEISRSLFHPWTTLPAIIIIASTIVYALATARKRPLVSFCILFFFANHIIEGTIIPLEIVYEHRNYVPSLFLFVPIAVWISHLFTIFSSRKSIVGLMLLTLSVIIVAQGHTVHMRNAILRWELTLWLDNAEKSPNLSLVHNNLGRLYHHFGLLPQALREFTRALKLNNYQNTLSRGVVHSHMGQLWLTVGRNDRAIMDFTKALSICPGLSEPLSGMAVAELRRGDTTTAYRYIKRALKCEPTNSGVHELTSIILLRQGRLHDAYEEAAITLDLNPQRILPLLVFAAIHHKNGEKEKALCLLEQYRGKNPKSKIAHFALIGLYHAMGRNDHLEKTIHRLLLIKGDKNFRELFERSLLETEAFVYPPDEETIMEILRKRGEHSRDTSLETELSSTDRACRVSELSLKRQHVFCGSPT